MRIKEHTFSTLPTLEKVERITELLLDKKGKDLLALDLSQQHAVVEAVVILTATSIRHGQGLADHILAECRAEKIEFLGMEGYSTGQWILLDFNDIAVHIFQTDARELFRLDDLWPTAPVLLDKR